METHVYKQVDGHEIKANVFPGAGDGPRPGIVFIHGGGLIMGNREAILPSHIEHFTGSGYGLVSIDYRLAPETKLPEIVTDIEEAWTWLRAEGLSFGIDPEQLAVVGHSAGGYLALTAGHRLRPRPTAVVSFCGYGDLTGDWCTRPSPHYIREHDAVPKKDARAAVGESVTSASTRRDSMRALQGRGMFYLYCRQQGIWLNEVSGHEPNDREWFKAYEPIHNVSPDYPPTMLIHGVADTDVPIEQSELMQRELARHGVTHEFLRRPEWGHAFLYEPDETVTEAFAQVMAFVAKHV
ncbi:MAG: alpha/beta hydrolase [Gammaproteobacteria bacterium]|nr:alpha/beta hydrolase [Gammaproteobacteria bacterium]